MSNDTVTDFLNAAEQYCALLENIEGLERRLFLSQLSEQLSALYLAATRLPQVSAQSEEILARTSVDTGDVEARVRAALGSLDVYWKIHDPLERSKPTQASLVVDLLEIFRDLRENPLRSGGRADSGNADSIWEWRHDFAIHWGDHSLNALRVVHEALGFGASP